MQPASPSPASGALLSELREVRHSAETRIGATRNQACPAAGLESLVWDGLITGPLSHEIACTFRLSSVFCFGRIAILANDAHTVRNTNAAAPAKHIHLKTLLGSLVNRAVLRPHDHQPRHGTNPKHPDKNFGLMLSVWGWVFGLGSAAERYGPAFKPYALPRADAPARFGTAQLGIISRQKDHVA